jgi:hypothetical protein
MSGTSHLGPTRKYLDDVDDTELQAPSDGVGLSDEDILHTGKQGAEPGRLGGQ